MIPESEICSSRKTWPAELVERRLLPDETGMGKSEERGSMTGVAVGSRVGEMVGEEYDDDGVGEYELEVSISERVGKGVGEGLGFFGPGSLPPSPAPPSPPPPSPSGPEEPEGRNESMNPEKYAPVAPPPSTKRKATMNHVGTHGFSFFLGLYLMGFSISNLNIAESELEYLFMGVRSWLCSI